LELILRRCPKSLFTPNDPWFDATIRVHGPAGDVAMGDEYRSQVSSV